MLVVLAIFRLSGNTSKNVIAIKAPAEKAKKYCKPPEFYGD